MAVVAQKAIPVTGTDTVWWKFNTGLKGVPPQHQQTMKWSEIFKCHCTDKSHSILGSPGRWGGTHSGKEANLNHEGIFKAGDLSGPEKIRVNLLFSFLVKYLQFSWYNCEGYLKIGILWFSKGHSLSLNTHSLLQILLACLGEVTG